MSLASYLPSFHRDATERMGATNAASDAAVLRFIGLADPDSEGYEAEEWATVHTGPMRLAGAERGASTSRTITTPGGEVQLAVRIAHFPIGTPPFEDGDLIEITAGQNAGTLWRVVEGDRADQQTAYRVPVVAHNP